MDEKLKYKIYFTFLTFLGFLTIYGIFGYWKAHSTLQETPIIVHRSSLKDYKLIQLYHTSDGYKMDLLRLDNNQEINGIFLSKECPEASTKEPGIQMKLDTITYFLPKEQETYQSYDRAYDYLCTNENMAIKDSELMKKIQQARVQFLENTLHTQNQK